MKRLPLLLLLLLATLSSLRPAFAQTANPEDDMYRVAKKLNCPTCAGRNLADCPTDTCTQWKQEIVAQLKAGKSEDQIVDYFKARFGEGVLQEPPKQGFILLMWIVPLLVAAGLIVAAVSVVRRSSRLGRVATTQQAATPDQAESSTDSYVAALEREVRDRA
jgi:cytochrome c-type biogenesis protein CcmH